MLSFSMASAFASEKPVSIQIRAASEAIRAIRYQSGSMPDKAWNSALLSGDTLELKGFASETDFLFVQQSNDGIAWGDLYVYQYDSQTRSWSVAEFPPKGFVRFSIKGADGLSPLIRYQYGKQPGQEWKTADSSLPLIIETFDSGKEFLFVQQALKNQEDTTKGIVNQEEWSDTYTYQYDYLLGRWSLFVPKQEAKRISNTSLDVKGHALLPTGSSSDFYSYLLGGGIQANVSLGKLLGYTGITFSKGPPKSAWVKSQQDVSVALGMGYVISLSKKVELTPEIGYGAIFNLLEADFDKDGTYSFEFFVDQQVRLALYLTYAFNERYKLFIAPLGVAFFEKNDFGIMYGCQGGIRVSL